MPGNNRGRTPAIVLMAALGLLSGCTKKSETPTQPSPTTSDAVAYTALGASDAVGVGASVPCLPFVQCPDGTGYVPLIARRLAETRTVTTTNLGIPAAVLSPEVQELGNRYGRNIPANFIQGELPFVPRSTTLVTIFAGGNDTNAIGTAIEGGAASGADVRVFIDGQVTQFRGSIDTLVRGIKQRSASAKIVVANLPNFAGLPFTQGYSLARRQAMQRISVGLSRDAINVLTSQNVSIVDLLCDPRSYEAANYSSDGFHPNDRGYAFIAEAFLAAIRSTSLTEPQATCPQTVLVAPL